MPLEPSEAAVLIIRRNDSDTGKYFLAVRRRASGFDSNKDITLGSFQVAIAEFGEPEDFAAAFDKAVAGIRQFGPSSTAV